MPTTPGCQRGSASTIAWRPGAVMPFASASFAGLFEDLAFDCAPGVVLFREFSGELSRAGVVGAGEEFDRGACVPQPARGVQARREFEAHVHRAHVLAGKPGGVDERLQAAKTAGIRPCGSDVADS